MCHGSSYESDQIWIPGFGRLHHLNSDRASWESVSRRGKPSRPKAAETWFHKERKAFGGFKDGCTCTRLPEPKF